MLPEPVRAVSWFHLFYCLIPLSSFPSSLCIYPCFCPSSLGRNLEEPQFGYNFTYSGSIQFVLFLSNHGNKCCPIPVFSHVCLWYLPNTQKDSVFMFARWLSDSSQPTIWVIHELSQWVESETTVCAWMFHSGLCNSGSAFLKHILHVWLEKPCLFYSASTYSLCQLLLCSLSFKICLSHFQSYHHAIETYKLAFKISLVGVCMLR